jgi:hypothetical protein
MKSSQRSGPRQSRVPPGREHVTCAQDRQLWKGPADLYTSTRRWCDIEATLLGCRSAQTAGPLLRVLRQASRAPANFPAAGSGQTPSFNNLAAVMLRTSR